MREFFDPMGYVIILLTKIIIFKVHIKKIVSFVEDLRDKILHTINLHNSHIKNTLRNSEKIKR